MSSVSASYLWNSRVWFPKKKDTSNTITYKFPENKEQLCKGFEKPKKYLEKLKTNTLISRGRLQKNYPQQIEQKLIRQMFPS